MDLRLMSIDNTPLLHTLHHMMEAAGEDSVNAPSKKYVRDAKAMAATPVDVKEYPDSYVFVVDMPGLKSRDIKVQVEEDNVLLISGERKREEEKEVCQRNANTDAISAVSQDGVLTVTVQKLPPPEPKKPKTIQVKVA
ncbi:hypothetical protein EJD97_023121 [Solanum chilense]|uniref:SHSP domain-containing protein n=1 Tax=Solanum chilense TaxID=4083 RepID=A0A6N2AT01_SOLCI|nr:hypothetical protein EJD97_023121 [Solanum chilense]